MYLGSDHVTPPKISLSRRCAAIFFEKIYYTSNFASKDFVQRIFSMIVNLLTNGDHKIVWFSPFS